MSAKLQEDPLVAIRKREEEARRQFLQNPIQLKKLQEALKQQESKKKKKKKAKTIKSDSESDLDQQIANKLKALKENPLAIGIAKKERKSKHKDDSLDIILMHKFNELKDKLSKKDMDDILAGRTSTSSDYDSEDTDGIKRRRGSLSCSDNDKPKRKNMVEDLRSKTTNIKFTQRENKNRNIKNKRPQSNVGSEERFKYTKGNRKHIRENSYSDDEDRKRKYGDKQSKKECNSEDSKRKEKDRSEKVTAISRGSVEEKSSARKRRYSSSDNEKAKTNIEKRIGISGQNETHEKDFSLKCCYKSKKREDEKCKKTSNDRKFNAMRKSPTKKAVNREENTQRKKEVKTDSSSGEDYKSKRRKNEKYKQQKRKENTRESTYRMRRETGDGKVKSNQRRKENSRKYSDSDSESEVSSTSSDSESDDKRKNSEKSRIVDGKFEKSSQQTHNSELDKIILQKLRSLRNETESERNIIKETHEDQVYSQYDSDDDGHVHKRKVFGLVKADGTKIPLKEKLKFIKPVETKSVEMAKSSERKRPKKLTEYEKEELRRQMMRDAEDREKERSENLRRHREENEKEEKESKTKQFDKNFVHKELLKSTKEASVESRIKSNLNNIQRSSRDMTSNFSKRH